MIGYNNMFYCLFQTLLDFGKIIPSNLLTHTETMVWSICISLTMYTVCSSYLFNFLYVFVVIDICVFVYYYHYKHKQSLSSIIQTQPQIQPQIQPQTQPQSVIENINNIMSDVPVENQYTNNIVSENQVIVLPKKKKKESYNIVKKNYNKNKDYIDIDLSFKNMNIYYPLPDIKLINMVLDDKYYKKIYIIEMIMLMLYDTDIKIYYD